MKKYRFLIVACCAAILFPGCGKDDTPQIPVVKTDNPTIGEVSYKGGEVDLNFAVSKGVRPYVDVAGEWAQVLSSDAGSARLAVRANQGAARTTTVTVSYYDAEPLVFTLSQAAKPPLSERLVVTAEDVTHKQLKVVCRNVEGPELWYYFIVMQKPFYLEKVAPDPAGWVAGNVKEKYDSWKFFFDYELVTSSFEEYYLLTNAEKDEMVFSGEAVKFDTDYVIVAYELDPQARFGTEISTCETRTKPLPAVEMLDLTFGFNLVMSGDANKPYRMTLTPSIKDVRHFSYVALEEEYKAMLAAFGGDIDKLAEEFRKQFLESDVLWKYINLGVYQNTFGGIEDTDGDGKVSLVALACGMDDYNRINSKAQASAPFVLDAARVQGAAGYLPSGVSRAPQRSTMLEKRPYKVAGDR